MVTFNHAPAWPHHDFWQPVGKNNPFARRTPTKQTMSSILAPHVRFGSSLLTVPTAKLPRRRCCGPAGRWQQSATWPSQAAVEQQMAVAGKAGVCSCCRHRCKDENDDIGNASNSNISTAPNAAAAAQHMSTAAECRHMIRSVAGDLLIASRSSHQHSSPHKLLKGSLILRNFMQPSFCLRCNLQST